MANQTLNPAIDQCHDKAHSSFMSLPQNDNGKLEGHMAAAVAALHAAGLDGPVELLASKIKTPVEGAP